MRLEKWDFKRSFIASWHDFNVHVFGHKREDIASVRSHRDSLQTVNVLFFFSMLRHFVPLKISGLELFWYKNESSSVWV